MDKNNYWLLWLKAAVVRAIRTFAQVMASGITVGAALHEISWGYAASCAAVAAAYSLLMALAGLPEVKSEKPKEEDDSDAGDSTDNP